MAHSSSIFSFKHRRWLAYVFLVGLAWLLFGMLGATVADAIGGQFGGQIVSAAKHRILDPSHFVYVRLYELVYLLSVLLLCVGFFEIGIQILARFVPKVWRFFPISILAFVILNGMCHFAGSTALYWMTFVVPAPNLRMTNAKLSEVILFDHTACKRGMVLGSSQANAQVGVTELNRLVDGAAIFAEQSYQGGHPLNVLMLQADWKEYPDIGIWYLSLLDFHNHIELGAVAQQLMNQDSYADMVACDGQKAIGPVRMRYGKIGMVSPLFRIRRSAEAVIMGVQGTPPVVSYHERRTSAEEKNERQMAAFIGSLRDGVNDEYAFSIQFQRECVRRVVERFQERGTQLFIIQGHVHPQVEEAVEKQQAEFVDFLATLQQTYEGLTILRDELPRPSSDQYRDFTHLDELHRSAYTQRLLQVLRAKKVL